jgi:hypothetical protein
MNKHNHKFFMFVGDVGDSVCLAAKKFNHDAFLLDQSNYKILLDQDLTRDIVVYTSLGDMPKNLQVFIDICLLSDKIFYIPAEQWSDKKSLDDFDPTSSTQGLLEHILLLVSGHVEVNGLENIKPAHNPVALVDSRKTIDAQLWIAGCSISNGLGVDSTQRYGQLLADELGMKCSFLTRNGSAIDWASDQIVRSDIRKNDIVIFGITGVGRMTYVHDKKLIPGITITSYDHDPRLESIISADHLLTQNTFYNHVNSIDRAVNFCNQIGAKILLLGLLIDANILRHLVKKPNFYHYPYNFTYDDQFYRSYEDLGTDNAHPGPLQHQKYKNFILGKLTNI